MRAQMFVAIEVCTLLGHATMFKLAMSVLVVSQTPALKKQANIVGRS